MKFNVVLENCEVVVVEFGNVMVEEGVGDGVVAVFMQEQAEETREGF